MCIRDRNNTHLAIMCLQAFSAFGVFLMKQFYEGVPTELCEAARIDGLSEYGIWWHIMLPLSLPALSTLTIFTFVNTWNDFLGPLIYLTKTCLLYTSKVNRGIMQSRQRVSLSMRETSISRSPP